MLYRVRIGEDVYLGSAEEVLAFLMRAAGGQDADAGAYMRRTAGLLAEAYGVRDVDTSGPEAYLLSLRQSGVVPVETLEEPDPSHHDPGEALGDGPVVFGEGVDPDDIPV